MFLDIIDKSKNEIVSIKYNVTYKKVKNINMRIGKDNVIEVSASRYVSVSEIERVLKEKSKWILSVISKNKNRNDYKLAEEIDDKCEQYFLFGKEYKLNFVRDEEYFKNINIKDNKYCDMKLQNIKISMESNNIYINSTNMKWKKEFINFELNIFISEIRALLTDSLKQLSFYNISVKNIKIKTLKSCWGNCHVIKKEITLNRKLVNYDKECLRYVIIHELSHLLHANHSKEFYNVVEKAMPNYKKIRKILNES